MSMIQMTMTINNVGRLELSRFYGIFGIVSTDLRHILLILVAIDIYALLKSLSKKCDLIVQIGRCGGGITFLLPMLNKLFFWLERASLIMVIPL